MKEAMGITTDGITAERLRTALRNDEFRLVYQPVVSVYTGHVVGAEGLLRWHPEGGGAVPPGTFIPVAERLGLIGEITRTIFERVRTDAALLRDLDDMLQISMNIGASDLQNGPFIAEVEAAFASGSLKPGQIIFEVTEHSALKFAREEYDAFSRLLRLGVRFAMDDYGTGHANLSSLYNAPFSKLKLDRSFIQDLATDEKKRIIVRDSIRMGHLLEMQIVAEGVEDATTLQLLQDAGCEEIQGFFFSQPLPMREFIAFLRGWDQTTYQNIRGLLYLAQVDHLEWRKHLIDSVFRFDAARDDRRELFRHGNINPAMCRFGHWYYGAGDALRELPEFRAIETPHSDLHFIAHELITEGTREDRDISAMVGHARELTRKSLAVLELLSRLEEVLFLQGYDSH